MSTTSERIKGFFPEFLTLTEGFAGQPFKLLEWQQEIIDTLFEEDEHGERLYSSIILEIPRKNAKTQLAAGLGLSALVGLTGEKEPFIICAAYSKEQAKILFNKCKKMIQQNPAIESDFEILNSGIIKYKPNNGVLQVFSSDSHNAHGHNPSMIICDELHTWKTTALWDALTTGSGTRQNFQLVGITTAGYDKKSLLGGLRSEGLSARHMYNGEWKGTKRSSSVYIAYGPEEGEIYDPTDWEAFKRHNPSWSIWTEKAFRAQCDLNKNNEAALRQLFHNEWVSSNLGWMPLGAWERAEDPDAQLIPGERIVLGVDASITGDATAVVAAGIDSQVIQPIGIWEKPADLEDWLVPLNEMKEVIRAVSDQYTIAEVAFDPYWCLAIMQDLEAEGFNTVKFTTNAPAQMAPAVANFYHAAMNGILKHNGDARLKEHVYNCASKQTPRGTVITKIKQTGKIDAAVASVIAHFRANYYRNKPAARKTTGEILFLEM